MLKTQSTSKYSLYHYQACPFCAITRSVVSSLDVEVETRDILIHSEHRTDLINGGGKPQVPCLKIEEHGTVRWLYESSDIIQYFKQQAKQRKLSA